VRSQRQRDTRSFMRLSIESDGGGCYKKLAARC